MIARQSNAAFLRRRGSKSIAVPNSLEEAGGRVFTFSRSDFSQWTLARTTIGTERLNEELRHRIKTQNVPTCADLGIEASPGSLRLGASPAV